MKKLLFFLLLAGSTTGIFAQADTTGTDLKIFFTVPAFRINIVPDSSTFTNEQIVKNRPRIIMFFSPDCDHCQKEMKELLAYKNELKDIQIIMVSPAPYNEVKNFYETFELATMPNVKLGQDVNYKLGRIYKIRTFPSIYVYDKKGELAKAFVGNIGAPAILDALK